MTALKKILVFILRAVPADHGVCDVRQAAHPLEGAAHEAVLLLQLLKR